MTIHQCPKCELRFDWNTELDDHCWHDHPEFRHEYPAQSPPQTSPAPPQAPAPETTPVPERRHNDAGAFVGWLRPASGKSGSQRKPG